MIEIANIAGNAASAQRGFQQADADLGPVNAAEWHVDEQDGWFHLSPPGMVVLRHRRVWPEAQQSGRDIGEMPQFIQGESRLNKTTEVAHPRLMGYQRNERGDTTVTR